MSISDSRSEFTPRQHRGAVLSLGLALAVSVLPLRAEDVDTDATDLPSVLKSIADLEKLLTDGVSSNNARALRSLQEAAASPKATLEFYLEAKKAVDFDATGKPDADWRAWRDSNEETNKDPMNVAARQIQLRYLVLCLQATSGPPSERAETLKKVLPLLGSYLDDLAAKFPKLDSGQEIAVGSALDSSFAKHLKLDLTMDRKAGWPSSAADVSGLYEQIILPYYRAAGDPQTLLAAWDKRIAHETAVLRIPTPGGGAFNRFRRGDDRDAERERDKEASRLEDEARNTFKEKRLPQLQWQKERDGLLYGSDRVAAYSKLTQLLRSHLDHPSARAWLDELKNLSEGTYKSKASEDGEG
jgi:hypothetical protein